ncbi:UNVERIFIED_CONTAM: Peptidyl-prolyl cis-trans isomerase CYP65 [Sesamum calycinum]|uniref:RING-type E3 ubiquitin transferase n=1 Tax=Sesamum calycinum TaxID=2727403 RepID=A0AAW2MMV6_9LAMI
MGKKQHSKDRMFITKTEWATEWGGAKSKESGTPFKRLPFYCCALTFTPFEVPVCTADGSVFEIMQIIPYIRKYGRNPVTGAPLKQEDLISLTFHKNSEGEYHCPVLNKVFTEFTHIVAVKTTGNVFCHENPNALDSRVLTDFDHVKKNLKVDDEAMLKELGTEKGKEIALHGGGGSKAMNERAAALAAILAARSRIKDDAESKSGEKPKQTFSIVDAASAAVYGRSAAAAKADASQKTAARIAMHMAGERAPVNAKLVKSRFTTGAASRSFTSTSYDPVTKNEYEYVKVEKIPREEVINFMIQGGDPTGTGRGGESIWGKPFKDELNSKLVHSGRGVVSMANSGPHTNGSQFFMYKSANHLNFKHTVFGMVVGGLPTLSAMEKVPVDDDDRPLEEIKIISVEVYVNPYAESDEEEEGKTNEEKKVEDEENDKIGSWYSNPVTRSTETPALGGGVGKYLKARISQGASATSLDIDAPAGSVVKKEKLGV